MINLSDPHIRRRDISGISQFASEAEVLFPSGAKFDIVNVSKIKGTKRIHVVMGQIVDQDLKEAKVPSSETRRQRLLQEAEEELRKELAAPLNPAYQTENWLGKGKGMLGLDF